MAPIRAERTDRPAARVQSQRAAMTNAERTDVIQTLQESADSVKIWGNARLRNGKTLREALTIQDVPLWDVVAVDLARVYVPMALWLGTRHPPLAQRFRPYLSWAKRVVFERAGSRRRTSGRAARPERSSIVFLGFATYMYRDVLQPVIAELARADDNDVVSVYDGRDHATACSVRGSEARSIWGYWDDRTRGFARTLERDLQAVYAKLRATAELPRIVQCRGRSLWPQLGHTLRWFFRVHLPRLLEHAAIAQHLLQAQRPALVVSPDVADPRTRLYCLLAGRLGIPSLQIQFGGCGPDATEWQFFVGDRLAVWSEQCREVMLSHGVPAEVMTITGSPRHDSLAHAPEAEVAETRARLGVPRGRAMILFASVFELHAHVSNSDRGAVDAVKRAVFDAAARMRGMTLVVKPHPLEDAMSIKRHVGARENIVVADPRADIRDLIKACDAFVTLGSTSTFDALIANKLVVCPLLPIWPGPDLPFYAGTGATVVARSEEEIASVFHRIAEGSSMDVLAGLEGHRRPFLDRWVHRVDGQAASRVATLAGEMAKPGVSVLPQCV